ncbi:MAG: 50S ribosomal protein L4 [Ignavibacteria bacterium]|nr:50S ribosomal protein L4 [Ignavibacteria bacterium]
MTLDVLKQDGTKAGSIELPASVFEVEPNEHAMYMAVRAYLTHRRQGTAKTKTRSEVRGGGHKPFKQKGTGGARRGTNRSPLMPGGGTIHGPVPRTYSVDIPLKMKRLARKSALSLRATENNIIVVEDFTLDTAKTKSIIALMKSLNVEGSKVLMLIPQVDKNIVMSARNVPGFTTFLADKISTYDVLNHGKLVIFKSAIDTIRQTFGDAN